MAQHFSPPATSLPSVRSLLVNDITKQVLRAIENFQTAPKIVRAGVRMHARMCVCLCIGFYDLALSRERAVRLFVDGDGKITVGDLTRGWE